MEDNNIPFQQAPLKPGVTQSKQKLPIITISVFILFLLVNGIWGYLYLTKQTETTSTVTIPTQIIKPTVNTIPFQTLLKKECGGGNGTIGSEKINTNILPFNFSSEIIDKYKIGDQLSCYLTPSEDSNNGLVETEGLMMGDSASGIVGIESHFLDYEKEVNINKQILIYHNNDIRVVVRGDNSVGPFCATDLGFNIELRVFRSIGDYRISIVKKFTIKKNPQLDELVFQYGEPIPADRPMGMRLEGAKYNICNNYDEYEKAVINKFIPDYQLATADIKLLIDSMVSDISGVDIKQ
jgi:hypothetical protein